MQLHFKKLTLALLVLSLVGTGFGCKGLSAEQKAAVKPVSLEYWTVTDDVDAISALIGTYRKNRPYLNVAVRQLSASELYPRLVEALAEDRGPDIISVDVRSLNTFQSKLAGMPTSAKDTTVRVEKGQFSDTTVVDTKTVNLPTPDQLDREFVQTVKGDVMRGGKIYGLPLSLDTMALYYNKDLLDRAGIPEPPRDWKEFQAAVEKITKFDKATGKILQAGAALGTGNNIPGSDDLLFALFKQSNVPFVDRNGRAVFNQSGKTGEILSFYTDFANPLRVTYTWNEAQPNALDSFTKGSLAFFFGYSHQYATIKARAPQLNLEVLPLFQLNTDIQANVANYSIQTVVAKSKHQNEAWALINYLTHTTAVKEYLQKTKRLTALRTFIEAQRADPALAPFVDQTLVATNWYRGRNYEVAQRAVADMLREWLSTPPDPDRVGEWKQGIINRAAEKINQTL